MSDQEQINKNDIDWIKQTLSEIKDQTTLTNGRVSALEAFKIRAITYGSIALLLIPTLIDKILDAWTKI